MMLRLGFHEVVMTDFAKLRGVNAAKGQGCVALGRIDTRISRVRGVGHIPGYFLPEYCIAMVRSANSTRYWANVGTIALL